MYCSKCGNEIDDDAVFCVKCGFKIDYFLDSKEETKTIVNQEENLVRADKTEKGNAVLLGILAIVIIAIAVIIPVTISTPEKTMKKAFHCINNNDIEGLLTCCSPEIESSVKRIFKFTEFFGIDMDDASAFAQIADKPNLDFKIIDIEYSDNKYSDMPMFSDLFNSAYSKTAVVTFVQSHNGDDGEEFRVALGNDYNKGWLIIEENFLNY